MRVFRWLDRSWRRHPIEPLHSYSGHCFSSAHTRRTRSFLIGLCGLTEEEVLAVAEHEHLPEVVATALAQYLLSREHGSEDIRDMIVEDIRQAQWSGNKEHVLTLLVHRQHSCDKLGRLKKGVFLAHRSVHRSEDETEPLMSARWEKQGDGTWQATVVVVGRDGITPPM